MKPLNIARMDWNKLRWFYLMAPFSSLTQAALHLNVEQSLLSRKLGDLEYILGMKLFARNARGISLRQEGRELLDVISRFFQEFTQYEDHRLSQQGQVQGSLRVALSPVLPLSHLIRDTSSFSAAYPEIQLHFIQPCDAKADIMQQGDCAIQVYDGSRDDLIQQPLLTLTYGLYASRSYQEQQKEDLKTPSWIRLKTASGQNWGCPDIQEASHTFTTAQDVLWAVQQGLGIAALPRCQAEAYPDLMALPYGEETKIDLYYAYPKHHQHCKRVTLYGDFLKKTFHQEKAKGEIGQRPSPTWGIQGRVSSQPSPLVHGYKQRETPTIFLKNHAAKGKYKNDPTDYDLTLAP